jgi:hypothetical protein
VNEGGKFRDPSPTQTALSGEAMARSLPSATGQRRCADLIQAAGGPRGYYNIVPIVATGRCFCCCRSKVADATVEVVTAPQENTGQPAGDQLSVSTIRCTLTQRRDRAWI